MQACVAKSYPPECLRVWRYDAPKAKKQSGRCFKIDCCKRDFRAFGLIGRFTTQDLRSELAVRGAVTTCTMTTSLNTPTETSTGTEVSICRWEGSLSNGIGATTGLPQAFLSADPNELVLSGTLGTYHLPRASVVKVGRGMMYPWFFAGIRFHHSILKFPNELQFKSSEVSSREILNRLRSMGYPVA